MGDLFTYLPWLWFSIVIVGTCSAEMIWSGVVILRAADVEYDPGRCANRHPKIDLRKALRRRVSLPRLGLPLLTICAALFMTQLLWMSTLTYTLISIGWFVTAPLRNLWGIAVSRRLYAVRHGHAPQTGYWTHVHHYYTTGLSMPKRPRGQRWFVGRLRWMNRFQNLGFLIQIYRFWGIFGFAVASLFWPITSAFAIFYHQEGVDRREYLRPWWRFDRDRNLGWGNDKRYGTTIDELIDEPEYAARS